MLSPHQYSLLCIWGNHWMLSFSLNTKVYVIGPSGNGYALRSLMLWKSIHSTACLTRCLILSVIEKLHGVAWNLSLFLTDERLFCSVSIIWFAGILSSCFYSPFCEIHVLGCSWEMETSEGSWNSCGSPIWWWHGQQWSWSQCTWCWSNFRPRVC